MAEGNNRHNLCCQRLPFTFEELEFSPHLSDENRLQLRKHDKYFGNWDRRILYFVVVALIINNIVILFSINII
jgi:hypothetical protein